MPLRSEELMLIQTPGRRLLCTSNIFIGFVKAAWSSPLKPYDFYYALSVLRKRKENIVGLIQKCNVKIQLLDAHCKWHRIYILYSMPYTFLKSHFRRNSQRLISNWKTLIPFPGFELFGWPRYLPGVIRKRLVLPAQFFRRLSWLRIEVLERMRNKLRDLCWWTIYRHICSLRSLAPSASST